jgi:uncharacterized membrane protein YkvI
MKVFAAWLALGFGTFLAVAEVLRNAGEVQWWPFWVVDYIAVALLLWGAAAVLWRPEAGRGLPILTAGWGFACAMFWMSLFGHIDELTKSGVPISFANVQSGADEPVLTIIIGVLFALTVAGLVASLTAELRSRAEAAG